MSQEVAPFFADQIEPKDKINRPLSPTPSDTSFVSSSSWSSHSTASSEHSPSEDQGALYLSAFLNQWTSNLITDVMSINWFPYDTQNQGTSSTLPNDSRSTAVGPGQVTKSQQKLACPFYQRDPPNHNKFTSCYHTGFDTVHRVKYVPIRIVTS